MPKEYLEVHGWRPLGGPWTISAPCACTRGQFQQRQRWGSPGHARTRATLPSLSAFLEAVRRGGESPPVDPLVAAHVTRATFAAVESARTGLAVEVE